MFLAPADASEEVDGAGDRFSPWYAKALFEEFGVLVNHARDDCNECFITYKKSVTAC